MKYLPNILFWFAIFFGGALFFSSLLVGGNIAITDQLAVLNLLVTISSIVFGLMGVWLAVIYADSLKKIFDSELKAIEKKDSVKNFRYLSKPMIVSAFNISYALLFSFLHPLLKHLQFLADYNFLLRLSSFSILCILMLAQIWTIIYIFAPAENIKNKAEHHIHKQDRHKELTKNTKTIR